MYVTKLSRKTGMVISTQKKQSKSYLQSLCTLIESLEVWTFRLTCQALRHLSKSTCSWSTIDRYWFQLFFVFDPSMSLYVNHEKRITVSRRTDSQSAICISKRNDNVRFHSRAKSGLRANRITTTRMSRVFRKRNISLPPDQSEQKKAKPKTKATFIL